MPGTSRPSSTKRAVLSRNRILRSGIRLADKSTIESLSMRKLAQSLNVEAMSLYNHVANKEDLLNGIVDIVIGEVEVPKISDDWRHAMRQRANSAHTVLLRHPWAPKLIVSRINVGPKMLRYVDATLGCLREAGFSYEMADHAWNAIDNHIYGYTLQELNFPIETTEYANVAEDYLSMIPVEKYPYLNALSQQIIAGSYDGVHNFEFGLNLILDGLEELRENG
jgi:AcrR family transcriptional regulator